MSIKSTFIFLTTIFQLLFFATSSFGNTLRQNPLTTAIQLFDKNKFDEAEPIFKQILQERPDDFMVNYFYGACRTENGHYSDADLGYLLKASKEVTPLNIDYYFGVQYQAKEEWDKALLHYNRFKKIASENEQQKVNLKQKMEQCAMKINPFVTEEEDKAIDESDVAETVSVTGIAATTASVNETKNQVTTDVLSGEEKNSGGTEETKEQFADITIETDSVEADSAALVTEVIEQDVENTPVEEFVQPENKPDILKEKIISFNINDEITYVRASNFKTDEGKIYFEQGNLKEEELENVLNETENLREKYKNTSSRAERDSIGQLILSLEGESYDLKNVVKRLFLQAKTAENAYWQNATPEETENFIKETEAISQQFNAQSQAPAEKISVTNEMIVPPLLAEEENIKTNSQKENKSGITYKIQIGAFSRGIPNNQKAIFKKISIIRIVDNYTDENGVVVYTTGNLTNYEDAVTMQEQVKQEGIKDPKIAAYLNGKRITLDQAKRLDKNK